MNVKDLREALKQLPDDAEVMIAIPDEGNKCNHVNKADASYVVVKTGWDIEFFDTTKSHHLVGLPEDEWEKLRKNKRIALLS